MRVLNTAFFSRQIAMSKSARCCYILCISHFRMLHIAQVAYWYIPILTGGTLFTTEREQPICRNGTWSENGTCNSNKEPETDYTKLEAEPLYNLYISNTVGEMKDRNRKVQYLDITFLSEFRIDGHPSEHREPGTPADAPQDCSHWCLPGVPDTWNELLYAHLLSVRFHEM